MRQPSLSHLYFETVRVSRAPAIWFVGAVLLHVGLFCLPMRNYEPSRQEIVFYQGNAGIEVELTEESIPPAIEQPAADAAEVSPVTDVALAESASISDEDSPSEKSKAPVLATAQTRRPEAKRATTGTAAGSHRAGTKQAQPAAQVFTPQPPYPPEARELGVEGAVRLQVRVGVDGCPRNVKLARSSGRSDFDLSSITTVRREWRFRPARTSDGAPVESTIVVKVIFALSALKS
jgi:TonB family protein